MANEEKQNEEEHTHPHWMDTIFSESNRDRFFYEMNRYFLVVDDNEIECTPLELVKSVEFETFLRSNSKLKIPMGSSNYYYIRDNRALMRLYA